MSDENARLQARRKAEDAELLRRNRVSDQQDAIPPRARTWVCEDCGWECSPNPYIPLAEAECDNCGGELTARP